MNLIIVESSKSIAYKRLSDKFSDDQNVQVILDRRWKERRQGERKADQDRRSRLDRRRLVKQWNGRDYIVVNLIRKQPPARKTN
jgi:hypothetical protein